MRWIGRAAGYTLLIENDGVVVRDASGGRVRLELENANPRATASPQEGLAGVSNYRRGTDPGRWVDGVPHYSRVTISDVYPGIDMVFYGNGPHVEYDFLVSPGADPRRIALRFPGALRTSLNPAGDLEIATRTGTLTQHKPRVYELENGGQTLLASSYRLRLGRVTLSIPTVRRDHGLRIDPTLAYVSYFGGSADDDAEGVAVDPTGAFYICGKTASSNFPLKNAADSTKGATDDEAYIAKFNPDGTLVYSTFLGGSDSDSARDIVADSAGNAYVVGTTASHDFPVINAIKSTFPGGLSNAFIAKLSPTGSILFATYFGGSQGATGNAVAIDTAGNIYACGQTFSPNIATGGVFQTTNHSFDGWIAKINAGGSAIVWATYLGGSGMDEAEEIAVDGAGNVYVVGNTGSNNFPTTPGAFQTTFGGFSDGFLSKLNASASALVYSTYLGGSGQDAVHDVALDAFNRPLVAGETWSSNFPVTAGALQATLNGLQNGFVARFNSSASTLLSSTYWGSVNGGVRPFPTGHFAVTGSAGSGNIQTTADAFAKSPSAAASMYLSIFQPSGTALSFSTFIGGFPPTGDFVPVEVDGSGNVYVAGAATSNSLSTNANSYQGANAGSWDGAVVKVTNTGLTGTAPVCIGEASAGTATFPASGGTSQITLAPSTACSWYVQSNQPFLQVASPAGSGGGTASFTVTANPNSGPRFASLNQLGRLIHIAQAGTSTTPPFDDVPLSHPYVNHIAQMLAQGITRGCGPTSYCPDASTTRGQMAVFIIRALMGDNFPYPSTAYFTDAPDSHPYFKYIQKMRELGITVGCSSTTYCPDATVTRGQMAVFIIRALMGNVFPAATTPDFTDVDPNDPYRPFINKMRELGITTGCGPTTYCSSSPVTRGQMGVFIVRAFVSGW